MKKKTAAGFVDDHLISEGLRWIDGKITFEEFACQFTMEDIVAAFSQLEEQNSEILDSGSRTI